MADRAGSSGTPLAAPAPSPASPRGCCAGSCGGARLLCHAQDDRVVRMAGGAVPARTGGEQPVRPTGADHRRDPRRCGRAALDRRLARAAARPLPALVVDVCRRLLRELPAGEGREHLCQLAIDRDPEARAAVVEAGYLPAAPKRVALFLFCTEQWERLDALDPDGARLRRHRAAYDDNDWRRLRRTAARSGRRCPEPLPARPWRPTPAGPGKPPYRPGGTGVGGTGGFGI
jgi:hypothetical protein